jgi:hypothetical protein
VVGLSEAYFRPCGAEAAFAVSVWSRRRISTSRSTSALVGQRRGQPVGACLLLHSDGGTFKPISTARLSVSLLYEGEVLVIPK